jgi:DNA polymerase-3 subunit beta
VSVTADIREPGRALVSGRLLAEIARSLPDRPVDVASDGSKVTLTCGSARFSLLTMPVEDYPRLPELPAVSGRIRSDAFAAAVGQVVVAAGRDDTLPVLTGVLVEIEGSEITMWTTDRYRLAVRKLAWEPAGSGLTTTALVPARTLADAAKSLTGGPEVQVALSSGSGGEGLLGFQGGTSTDAEAGARRSTTRLLDGEFPKVRSLFPAEVLTTARVPTAGFVEALRRVALVAERNTPVRLTFEDNTLTLEAGASDEAQATEAIDADIQGEGIGIAFNPGYLLDGLSAIGAPVTVLQFTVSTRPAVLLGAADDEAEPDGAYRYLLMPIRLSG